MKVQCKDANILLRKPADRLSKAVVANEVSIRGCRGVEFAQRAKKSKICFQKATIGTGTGLKADQCLESRLVLNVAFEPSRKKAGCPEGFEGGQVR